MKEMYGFRLIIVYFSACQFWFLYSEAVLVSAHHLKSRLSFISNHTFALVPILSSNIVYSLVVFVSVFLVKLLSLFP